MSNNIVKEKQFKLFLQDVNLTVKLILIALDVVPLAKNMILKSLEGSIQQVKITFSALMVKISVVLTVAL
jgi:hypothetical protein